MKENSSPYIASSSKPTRERVGLILDGANSAAAVKTIVATETAGVRVSMDGIITFLARRINDIGS